MCPKRGIDLPELLTMRLDERTRKRLEELAQREERSIGAMARIILREGLDARERKGKRKT
jgi:predicted transcriptional regulator